MIRPQTLIASTLNPNLQPQILHPVIVVSIFLFHYPYIKTLNILNFLSARVLHHAPWHKAEADESKLRVPSRGHCVRGIRALKSWRVLQGREGERERYIYIYVDVYVYVYVYVHICMYICIYTKGECNLCT